MTLLTPRLIVWKTLVRKGGQAETGVADPDILSFVSHDFCRDINQKALISWD